jgi:hypothetical protein
MFLFRYEIDYVGRVAAEAGLAELPFNKDAYSNTLATSDFGKFLHIHVSGTIVTNI